MEKILQQVMSQQQKADDICALPDVSEITDKIKNLSVQKQLHEVAVKYLDEQIQELNKSFQKIIEGKYHENP